MTDKQWEAWFKAPLFLSSLEKERKQLRRWWFQLALTVPIWAALVLWWQGAWWNYVNVAVLGTLVGFELGMIRRFTRRVRYAKMRRDNPVPADVETWAIKYQFVLYEEQQQNSKKIRSLFKG